MKEAEFLTPEEADAVAAGAVGSVAVSTSKFGKFGELSGTGDGKVSLEQADDLVAAQGKSADFDKILQQTLKAAIADRYGSKAAETLVQR